MIRVLREFLVRRRRPASWSVECHTIPLSAAAMEALVAAVEHAFPISGAGFGGGDGERWHAQFRLDPTVDGPAARRRLRAWLTARPEVVHARERAWRALGRSP